MPSSSGLVGHRRIARRRDVGGEGDGEGQDAKQDAYDMRSEDEATAQEDVIPTEGAVGPEEVQRARSGQYDEDGGRGREFDWSGEEYDGDDSDVDYDSDDLSFTYTKDDGDDDDDDDDYPGDNGGDPPGASPRCPCLARHRDGNGKKSDGYLTSASSTGSTGSALGSSDTSFPLSP